MIPISSKRIWCFAFAPEEPFHSS